MSNTYASRARTPNADGAFVTSLNEVPPPQKGCIRFYVNQQIIDFPGIKEAARFCQALDSSGPLEVRWLLPGGTSAYANPASMAEALFTYDAFCQDPGLLAEVVRDLRPLLIADPARIETDSMAGTQQHKELRPFKIVIDTTSDGTGGKDVTRVYMSAMTGAFMLSAMAMQAPLPLPTNSRVTIFHSAKNISTNAPLEDALITMNWPNYQAIVDRLAVIAGEAALQRVNQVWMGKTLFEYFPETQVLRITRPMDIEPTIPPKEIRCTSRVSKSLWVNCLQFVAQELGIPQELQDRMAGVDIDVE